MRLFIHGNNKQFWYTFLIFYLVMVFLAPSAHSHDYTHFDNAIHPDLNLKVAIPHDHAVNHAGESHSENLIAIDVNFTGFSKHDHNSNHHYHLLENPTLRANRGVRGLVKHNSLFLQEVSFSLAFKTTSSTIPNKLPHFTKPTFPKFIFIATNLPPPIV